VAILRCPDQSAGTGVRPKAISLEVVLASACLPRLHDAVDIYGEPHWDGGYAANPPLIPLVGASRIPDVLLVQLIPHDALPCFRKPVSSRTNTASGSERVSTA
jgi:NTE family protein